MDYQQAGGRGCYNCGDSSHQARDCPKRGSPTCFNCGEVKSTIDPWRSVANMTGLRKGMCRANVMRLRKRSHAIGAVKLDTFHANALTLEAAVEEDWAAVTLVGAEAEARSATSAVKLVTLRATVPKAADTVEVVTEGVTAEVMEAAVALADRLVTPAADMVICPGTARRVRSATTVVKSVTCPVIVPPNPLLNVSVTNASNLATSKQHVQTNGVFGNPRRPDH